MKHFLTMRLVLASVVFFAFIVSSGPALAEDRWLLTENGVKISETETPEGDFATWSGAKDENGYADGYGIMQWYFQDKAGVRYEGMMASGKRTGHGLQTWPNGDRYEGDFTADKLTGRGIFTAANGDRYEGDFIDGKAYGKGLFTWANGDRYEGDWVDNKRSGTGVFTWANGDRYEGGFVNDKQTGKGVFAWANGDRYEGNFVNDQQSGKGLFTAANGDRYEGDFRSGIVTGRGTFTAANGDCYKGDFVDGKGTGKGVFTAANGDRYEGDFLNDRRSGQGVFTWANGDRYEGGFVNGKLEGYGTFYRHEGMTKKGYWANGDYVGPTAPADSALSSSARQQIENRIVSKIYVQGNKISTEKAILAALPALQEGRTVDIQKLSGEILLANENNFRHLSVNFRLTGDKLGAYVLVQEGASVKTIVSVDNSGDSHTGLLRSRLTYLDGNVGGTGQTATFSYTTSPDHTADVKQFGFFYNIPLPKTQDNTYFSASYSDVNSGRIINEDFFSIDATGKGNSLGWHYVHNLTRKPLEKAGIDFGLDFRRYQNGTILNFVGTPINIGIDIDSLPFSVSYQESQKLGSDVLGYSLSYIHNIPAGGNNSTAQYEQYRYGTSASYQLWRANFSYQHAYPTGWLASIALSGQYTNERLIYPEQFGLGGIWSLRGMNERDVAGDRGIQSRFELYTPEFTKGQRALLFIDAGYFNNLRPIAGDLTSDSAVSCGLGWRYSSTTGLTAIADYGYILNGTVNTPAHSSKFHFAVSQVF